VPFCPSAWGLMAGFPGVVSHESSLMKELAANSGSSWMSGALNLLLAMLLLTWQQQKKQVNTSLADLKHHFSYQHFRYQTFFG